MNVVRSLIQTDIRRYMGAFIGLINGVERLHFNTVALIDGGDTGMAVYVF